MSERLTESLATALREARTSRGLSISALAERAGVSRAMITKVERGEAQPTAVLLARLAAALGMTLSELVARAEDGGGRLVRAADQPVWTDPATGYRRRTVSPAGGRPLELVEIELPAGAEVAYAADSYPDVHQQIWVLDGHLRLHEGDAVHELDTGDCLQLGPPVARTYVNPTDRVCRYLIALTRR
ncbi:MAG TPA: helix-turn-helix domain-containing protein [Pseudonocardia sp.]|uniref:helix-turn-helix domain-containing protein n=1 Tax=Pseudonocardia sp. TaxID=60912 RepID=UPI002B4B4A6A|nr:helix-turn-helix domain-containing protein [Pseudonocardia sp.]HLU57115.1 helix-turn-helix domain-containing protein [Pseudonocardia sp.]